MAYTRLLKSLTFPLSLSALLSSPPPRGASVSSVGDPQGVELEVGDPAGLAGLRGDGGGTDPHVGGDDLQHGPLLGGVRGRFLRFPSLWAFCPLLMKNGCH